MHSNTPQDLPESVTQEWQSPSGTAAIPGLPDGYQAQMTPDGSGTEIVPPLPPGQKQDVAVLTVWCLIWNGILVTLLATGAWNSPSARPSGAHALFILIPMLLMGLGMAAMTLSMAFVRTSWLVGPGSIARRTRIPLVGWSSIRPYLEAQLLEIRHGAWTSRRGSTDILRLRTARGTVTIREVYYSAFYADLKQQLLNPATGKPDWRAMWQVLPQPDPAAPIEVAPEIQGLGRFIAEQTGLPLQTIEEQIPQPKHASQRLVQ
jgi:hypothetical protein